MRRNTIKNKLKHIFPSVMVGVSAFNEENNIKELIKSILRQKEDGFVLEKILVLSDGSNDKTVEVVRSFRSKKIEVREYKRRMGKSGRLNEIYKSLKSDILFQTDADVILSDTSVIKKIIKPIIDDNKIGMCSGNAMPYKPTTFLEKAISVSRETYMPLKKTLRGGNNKLSVNGRILAYRKELVKKIKIPADVIGNDAFTYLCCLTKGFSYRYVEDAVVNFRSPRTLEDHIKQNTRFLAVKDKMTRYFSNDLVEREYFIPPHLLLLEMIKQFIKHPVLSIYIFLINRYCQVRAKFYELKMIGGWEISSSTKIVKN